MVMVSMVIVPMVRFTSYPAQITSDISLSFSSQTTLIEELKQVEPLLKRECSLPVDPTIRITGLNLDKCSYFSSFTVPLKLIFKCANSKPDKGVIFKVSESLVLNVGGTL